MCSGDDICSVVCKVQVYIYWANKVRDQTFAMQFLEDFELLVK